MVYPKIKTLKWNPGLEGMARLVPDVLFASPAGVELKMQILKPWSVEIPEAENPARPLIVFLQGSGFTFPDVGYELPQLAEYAKLGYVVATITHRSFRDGYPAPAYLEDAKTAIRFLRKNAGEYGIDPDRVCFWGTSSGGNTALLVAMTGDDPDYKTGEYPEYSDSVSIAIDCFGPADLAELLVKNPEGVEHFKGFTEGDLYENIALLKRMSPLYIVEKNKKYPPMLLIHGDADTLVPYGQSEEMYKALGENGNDVEMIRVENAPHEASFWSRELHAEIMGFIAKTFAK